MNPRVASDRMTSESASGMTSAGTNHRKAYLKRRWQKIIDQMAKKLDDALVMLLDINESGYEVYLASSRVQEHYDVDQIHETTGRDFFELVRDYGKLMRIDDSTADIRLTGAKEMTLGFQSLLGKPMYNQHEELIGVFVALIKEKKAITDGMMKDFEWLFAGIEESVRYLSIEEEINCIRNVDPLTRLISRDRMLAVTRLEFARSQRSDIPFSMILIDIDNFRLINENFGRDVGDQVLREFSEEIAARIRLVDTACRWNGNAFAVLCPQTDLLGANILVNDLFSSLTQHIFPHVGRCYFSVGIADFSPEDASIDDMLLRLDKALYRVKAFGGNATKTRYHNKG